MSNPDKISSKTAELENKEKEPWKKFMAYGSERFDGVESNNHNVVLFTDTEKIVKLVMGKDVALVLPKNPEKIKLWSGYPTHQESWLPMWFVLLYHSQHKTMDELEYKRNINERISSEDRELMKRALIYKANEFWRAYKEDAEPKPPKKKYKNITRILQDILLYANIPKRVIENQQEYLESRPLYPFVTRANKLRKGVGLETANELEQKVEQILAEYTQQVGAEKAKEAYDEAQKRIAENSVDEIVAMAPDEDISRAEFYADLASYDLSIAEDEHDQDVISIVSSLEEPQFHQIKTKFGAKLTNERRMDVIAIPESLDIYDVVRGGKESYQPVSMILATHAAPKTEAGKKMQERFQKELVPEEVAHHYLGAAEEFLRRGAWGKSFTKRFEKENTKQIKKAIPLYRVACDLLPRAVYMLKTGKFPTGISNDQLWEIGETKEEADKIQELFRRQDATQEELRILADSINKKFDRWYKKEDYLLFLENMEKMGQLRTLERNK